MVTYRAEGNSHWSILAVVDVDDDWMDEAQTIHRVVHENQFEEKKTRMNEFTTVR